MPKRRNTTRDPNNILTLKEAWEQVFEKTISIDRLYKEVRDGNIPHIRIGVKIIFRRDTLEEWFKQQEAIEI